jgi:hypothetical protein
MRMLVNDSMFTQEEYEEMFGYPQVSPQEFVQKVLENWEKWESNSVEIKNLASNEIQEMLYKSGFRLYKDYVRKFRTVRFRSQDDLVLFRLLALGE